MDGFEYYTVEEVFTMSDKTNLITEEISETRPSSKASDMITALIKELTDEISTTKSEWVKIRNSAEIAILTAALAELKNLINDLLDKKV
jgi:hypothetical protein